MAFTENLKVEIESVFDSAGFRQLEKRIKSAKSEFASLNAVMSNARGMADMRKQSRMFQDRLDRTSFSLQTVNDDVKNMSLGQLSEKFGITGDKAARARNQIRQFGGIIRNSSGEIARMGNLTQALTNQFDDLGAIRDAVPKEKNIPDPMAQFSGNGERQAGISFGEMNTNRVERGLLRVAASTDISNSKLRRLAGVSSLASSGLRTLSGGARRAATSLMQTSVSLQTLQMQLLGVQFSLLSLAFIFGGLMGSALGAVGIFKILGNTLKQFFLPAALSVLPLVLDLRDALLSIDSDTRESIGRIFMVVAAVGALGSIMAFATSGVLGFLQGVKMLFAPFAKLLFFFTEASSLTGLISNGFSMLMSAAGSLSMAIAGVLTFLGGFIAGFKVIDFIINKVSAAFGVLLTVLMTVAAGVLAFTGAVTAPFWSVAAAVGAAIGAIIAVLWNFRDTVWNILTGIAEFFIDIFKKIFNVLVGNSIIPDMVAKIVEYLTSIPSKIMNLGANIVDTIVEGIKNTGSAIWNAFKKILPDFLVDAIEGAGGAVKGIVDSAGNVLGSAGNTIGKVGKGFFEGVKDFGSNVVDGAKSFVGGGSKKANKASPKPGSEQSGTQVQNNNVSVSAEVNDKEETPQETGRQLGQGLNETLNNRGSSQFSSGT